MTENLSESSVKGANKFARIIVALAAIVLSAAIYFAMQTPSSSLSLEAQAEQSTPLETALANGKPTLTEFYANWCTTCQAMAQDLAQLKKEYGNSVNFVMLNVDNSKWLPEVLRYRVDGIPHFVFINEKGKSIAQSIGKQPLSIMEANLDSLIARAPLPYADSSGQTSEFSAPVNAAKPVSSDPRSHGAQVK
jgi:thiol-disulfide isomerase/thioredoxin